MADRTPIGSARMLRVVIALSMGVSVVLALALLARSPSPISRLMAAGLLAAAVLAWGLARKPSAPRTGAILLVASLNPLVVWPELVLRIVDFRYQPGVAFGFPDRIDFTRFAPDPELFWTYPLGQPGVNALGFRDEEVAIPKPPGVFRVLFLGDSCTDLGDPVRYPVLVERSLNAEGTDSLQAEAVVMAVSGYSSHQGRILAARYGPTVGADIAVVYFGWNDHWRARDLTDAEKQPAKPAGRLARSANAVIERARTLQLLKRGADWIARRGEHTPHELVRVPLPDYRANLTAIARALTPAGTVVIFVTAPTSWYRIGVSQRHVALGYVPDTATAAARHRAYNDVVREVASETQSQLLDLEAEFDLSPHLGDLMLSDGIHLTESGLALVAQRLTTLMHDYRTNPERGHQ